jgi:hypothetical protein
MPAKHAGNAETARVVTQRRARRAKARGAADRSGRAAHSRIAG